MRFYLVDQNMAPADNINIGYFLYAWDAFRVMSESDDRRVVMFEINQHTNEYEQVMVWEHPDEDED